MAINYKYSPNHNYQREWEDGLGGEGCRGVGGGMSGGSVVGM